MIIYARGQYLNIDLCETFFLINVIGGCTKQAIFGCPCPPVDGVYLFYTMNKVPAFFCITETTGKFEHISKALYEAIEKGRWFFHCVEFES